jgi:peptidyl-prolyl cis-trans isomerase A (cyclophilin A)
LQPLVLRQSYESLNTSGERGNCTIGELVSITNDMSWTQSNKRGMVTFAMAGPNTRSNQFFINYGDNARLDSQGFSPFGKVVDGMKAVDAMYGGYGEGAPNGLGPSQDSIAIKGNEYLQRAFPKLDYIKSATIVQ